MVKTTMSQIRACQWAVALGCGVLLAYVLSLGPVFAMQRHRFLPQFATVIEVYVQPANALAAFRPVQKGLEWYVGVWFELTNAPDTTI